MNALVSACSVSKVISAAEMFAEETTASQRRTLISAFFILRVSLF